MLRLWWPSQPWIAKALAEHVWMDGKAEAGGLTGPLDQALKSLPRHGATPLTDEHVIVLADLAIKPPQGAQVLSFGLVRFKRKGRDFC
jgi:hypothetical protein